VSSLVTQFFLLEKYGPRLDTTQLGEVLGLSAGVVRNKISANTLGIKTYVDGQRYADYRDVAEYIEACRERAKEQAGA
jgi:hypothetical protein